MPRWLSSLPILLTALLLTPCGVRAANDVDGGLASPAQAELLSPPVLRNRSKAVYPPEALTRRQEGTVGLQLQLDAEGRVLDAKVTSPAGQGFDEAALEAVRQFQFEPAKRDGVAIAATVKFSYEFHLSSAPAPVAPAAPLAALPDQLVQESSPDRTTVVTAPRPISAASSFAVQERAFNLRPIASVQDILRVTPGLLMVQHSGGGKANQYFLRGFDADHGTDLALSIDGMPINLVAHAHGQGYADTNFIIPEVVERVEISKGPYFAGQGDFATAGAVNMVSRDDFEHSSAGAGFVDSPGHGEAGYRALAIASPKFDQVKATFAAEIGRTNGPFDHPDAWDRYKLWNKVTVPIGSASSFTVGEMSYAGNWNGSGQMPTRAVEQGLVDRFGSLDPSEGGNTARHQVFAALRLRPTESSELRALAYAASYRFNLFSDFTLLLDDPVNGDEIEQIDRRVIYGGRVSYRVVHHLGAVVFDTTIGGETRNDDIHVELWHTARRQQLTAIRNDDVHESFVAAFINEEVTPSKWLRLDLGGRVDLLSFAVDSHLDNGGVGAAHQWSPKTSLAVTPIDRPKATLDFYLNYGHGFHSNDVRGVFAQCPVTPLTRAVGEEIGTRARLWGRWDLAAALWQLDLDNETVWDGDNGTTAVSGATTRRGVEFETRYEFTSWLAADLDLTYTHSQFSKDSENGGGLALAPKTTWAGGLSARHALGRGVARAGLRFFGIGDRPATDDGALVAPGFTEVDLHLGYRRRWFDVAFDVENFLDQTFRSAQFATTSRLPNEPAVGTQIPTGFSCGRSGRLAPNPSGRPANGIFYGCQDVDYTPAYPLTLRLFVTLFLD